MTVELQLNNIIVENLKRDFKTNNIMEAINKIFDKYNYQEERRISNDINISMKQIKQGNTHSLQSVLDDL
jgi:hypothetical protein